MIPYANWKKMMSGIHRLFARKDKVNVKDNITKKTHIFKVIKVIIVD